MFDRTNVLNVTFSNIHNNSYVGIHFGDWHEHDVITDPRRYTRSVDPMVNPDIPVKPDRLSGLSDRAVHAPTRRHSTRSFICGTSPELVLLLKVMENFWMYQEEKFEEEQAKQKHPTLRHDQDEVCFLLSFT